MENCCDKFQGFTKLKDDWYIAKKDGWYIAKCEENEWHIYFVDAYGYEIILEDIKFCPYCGKKLSL